MDRSTAQQKPAVILSRHYPVAPQKVWRAWTDPKALSRWFGPGAIGSVTRAELDVRTGGRYLIAFRTQDGREHEVSGVYQEVIENRKLSFTWAWKHSPDQVSLVSIALRPAGQGTGLEFRHEQLVDAETRDDHEHGWTVTLAKLASLLT
jgi:uncharacterized protein YndB with AHSA1/START domain